MFHFSNFVFSCFGHFSCMIFFSFFSHLAHLALQNVNIIFSYFRNFFSKSDQKPKPKNWKKEAKVPHFTEGCFINCPGVILPDFHWDGIIFKSQLLWNLIWIVDPFYPFLKFNTFCYVACALRQKLLCCIVFFNCLHWSLVTG